MIYPFSSYLYKSEEEVVHELLEYLDWPEQHASDIENQAIDMVEQVRQNREGSGQLEVFLQEFSLDTDEGIAIMCLAEALLRIPDAKTANALMKDRVAAANWLQSQGTASDWSAKAAGIGMGLTRMMLDSSLSRLGEPVIREAMIKAMQMMGNQFVLGTTINNAIANAKKLKKQGYRISYDILGEAARDRDTAQSYFESYDNAIEEIARVKSKSKTDYDASSISVKLSALHPRYEYAQKDRCVDEISERVFQLARKAAQNDISLTIDAEEVNRLDLSIEIFEKLLQREELKDWNGLGLAIQAYQKRALPLIQYLATRVKESGRKIHVRLVKGAYWDTEVKHAQMGGYPEYPVFTRKFNTDLSYLACAQELFKHQGNIYPMFGTHNAHTVCAIKHMAEKNNAPYEFQRLFGMGDALYDLVIQEDEKVSASIYAPVGLHRELLPYLVRRILENGANSSFVHKLLDEAVPANVLAADPVAPVHQYESKSHPNIPLPADIYGDRRRNSTGLDLDDPLGTADFLSFLSEYKEGMNAVSIVGGNRYEIIDEQFITWSFDNARQALKIWREKNVQQRALVVERFAELLEENRNELMSILVYEAGKTIPDARDELREAVDFCRYYAAQGRDVFDPKGVLLPGYTGETNRLIMQERGVFVCISPWNFPLAIFTGQVIAAIIAGNAVIAKPASQTPYIAMRAVELMHKAGIPVGIIQLLLGNGEYGSKILQNQNVSGVAFTGSTRTAKSIQKTLLVHNDSIVPFIAETGGQNAMVVDSSALLEQVVDDVIHSAFGSAGQRCSALRVLYLQNDIADSFITLLQGAMQELKIGAPDDLSVDISYIIDGAAKRSLDEYVEYISEHGRLLSQASLPDNITNNSRLFAPVAYEISNIHVLQGEVFGPILHVVRFHAEQLRFVVSQINRSGYGLTFGLHSRIQSRQDKISKAVRAGNIYVNRGMTGAVVGTQPFGGMGMSGTGPKAGGPYYLHAFAVEKVISTDITASGGNASLLSLDD